MYVVVATRPEVDPVAVIVFAPPVVSATISVPGPKSVQDPVVPVVQVNDVVVNAVVVPVTVSALPNPVTESVEDTPSSGKPKLLVLVVTLNETFGVMVNGVVTLFVPSLTTMVSEPPGRAGTVAVTRKAPVAVVVRQNPEMRLSSVPTPLFAKLVNPVQVAAVSHWTVVVPTMLVIAIGFALRKPVPVMTRLDPTVPDVAAVRTPLEVVDRVTVGLAA